MKTFAAILLLGAVAAAKRSDGLKDREDNETVGAENIKAMCKSMSDEGKMTIRAQASSWEADGSGDVISPDKAADRVAAAEVMIRGNVRVAADSTSYAFIESDCTAEAPDSYDSAAADFEVNGRRKGRGNARFTYKTTDFLASDLIDGAMTLNIRDAAGASMLCCTFEAPIGRGLVDVDVDQN